MTDSKFYEYENDVLDRLYGKATEDEINVLLLAKLDEILSSHNDEADWLEYHYNSAVDCLFDGEYDEDFQQKCIEMAKTEIAIFRKNGYNDGARHIEHLLDMYYNER